MNIQQRDLEHIWHPCSQMKDYQHFPPIEITSASGSYLNLKDGRKIIDAISSWWCKSLGHNHPQLRQALIEQTEKFEHVILANTTNETIVTLSEKLTALTPHLNKVFYAGDGSCAIEIAMKMALHAQQIRGSAKRTQFISLANGYHGETCAALGASDLGMYRQAYEPLLPKIEFLQEIPYVSGKTDPLWNDCSEYWPAIEMQLEQAADSLCAILFEPIVQGAGGMKIYSQNFLYRLAAWAKQKDIYLIADEIMTGFARTGPILACEHANVDADFVCLSKGLTAGWLPLSAVLTSDAVYELFYDDYAAGKSFLHSHTFTGNALAAAVAIETLNIYQNDNIVGKVNKIEQHLQLLWQEVADETQCLENIRAIGGIVAADLKNPKNTERLGYQVYQKAVSLGALLRPLGNTLYWFPPLNTSLDTLKSLQRITKQALVEIIPS